MGGNGPILYMNYSDYVEKMVADGRFATISNDGRVVVLMFFSVCKDPKKHLENLEHKYLEHDPNGYILVIEDMISTEKFGMKYIDVIEDIFCMRYPNLERFMWRRRRESPRTDKIYSIGRRHSYAV